MKQINLSYLITGILLLKILDLVMIFKDINLEKKFFLFFFKILSSNLKRIFFVNLNSFLKLLLEERITLNMIKIFLNKGLNKKLNKIIRRFEIFKSHFFFQKKVLNLCDLLFQFPFTILKKKTFLNNSVIHSCLNLTDNIYKFPTLRLIVSGKDTKIKKKIENSINNLTYYWLENPVICSKLLIQDVIWAYFRLGVKLKKNLKFLSEIRSFSFFNNSKNSLSLFSFLREFFDKKKFQSCINICFKNFHLFVNNKFGCFLIIFIIKKVFLDDEFWLNFSFFKSFFKNEPFISYFYVIFFKFLFRRTTRCLRSFKINNFFYIFKKSEVRKNLIEIFISKKKKRIKYFLFFVKEKIFKTPPKIYPSFFQDEFIQMIEFKKVDREFKSFDDVKIYSSNNISYIKIKKPNLLLYTRKVKNFSPKIHFIFFLLKIIWSSIWKKLKLKKSFARKFSGLIFQIHSRYLKFKENFPNISKISLFLYDKKFIEFYRIHNIVETC
jgi:hypothetical protein